MKVLAAVLISLGLTGCANLGSFVGTAAGAYRNETRGPEVVYVQPQPRPYWRPYWRRGW